MAISASLHLDARASVLDTLSTFTSPQRWDSKAPTAVIRRGRTSLTSCSTGLFLSELSSLRVMVLTRETQAAHSAGVPLCWEPQGAVKRARISPHWRSQAAGGSPQPVVMISKGITRSVRLITRRTVSAEWASEEVGWVG